jgi:hypothetical protein
MKVFAVRLVHMNNGWRFWAFHVSTGADVEFGLRADGYESEAAAMRAIAKAKRAVP